MSWKKKYEEEVKARSGDAWQNAFKPIGPTFEQGKVAGRKEIAQALIEIFELQDSYPDVTESKRMWKPDFYTDFFGYAHGKGGHYEDVEFTVEGWTKLVEDILNAKDAVKSNTSLKKLRKALKNKKEDK